MRSTHFVAALPSHIQANAVEEIPGPLAKLGQELRKFDGELKLGDALGQPTGLVKSVEIKRRASSIQEFDCPKIKRMFA